MLPAEPITAPPLPVAEGRRGSAGQQRHGMTFVGARRRAHCCSGRLLAAIPLVAILVAAKELLGCAGRICPRHWLLAGRSGSAALVHSPTSLRSAAANFLDDIGTGMRDPATSAAMGMSVQESSALLERCKSGDMDFIDFMSITCFLNHMGGAGGMVPLMAQLPDPSETFGMEDKLKGYKAILDVLTPAERSEPASFLSGDESARQNVARVAKACGRGEVVIDQFLLEFKTMRRIMADLGAGKSMDKVTRNMALHRAEEEATCKSRMMRRKVKRSICGPKRPEWLDS